MARDKENLNKWNREYYNKKKNDPLYKEKRRLSALKYYRTHKEQYAKNQREYFLNNKERYRKYRREYRYINPVGIYSVIKDGLNRNKSPRKNLLKISKENFVKWYNSQDKKCFYCGATIEQIKKYATKFDKRFKRLTIDRVDNLKGYEIGNIVLACYRCNAIKGDFFTKREMSKIGVIIRAKRT